MLEVVLPVRLLLLPCDKVNQQFVAGREFLDVDQLAEWDPSYPSLFSRYPFIRLITPSFVRSA